MSYGKKQFGVSNPLTLVFLLVGAGITADESLRCVEGREALTQDELIECFGIDLLGDTESDDDQSYFRLVVPHWKNMDEDARLAALGRYRDGLSARAAVAVGVEPRTPATVALIHEQAIELGRQEYVSNMIVNDPVFTTGRRANMTEADKQAVASRDYSDIIIDFLTENDNDSMERFVRYAPSFAYYAVQFPNDFLLADRLQQEINIAESRARIEELTRRIEALDRLAAALRGELN